VYDRRIQKHPHTHTLYIYTYVVRYYIVRPYIARRCALIYKHSDIRKPLEKQKKKRTTLTKNTHLHTPRTTVKQKQAKNHQQENDPLSNEKKKQKKHIQ